jgi:hypothetical protein
MTGVSNRKIKALLDGKTLRLVETRTVELTQISEDEFNFDIRYSTGYSDSFVLSYDETVDYMGNLSNWNIVESVY